MSRSPNLATIDPSAQRSKPARRSSSMSSISSERDRDWEIDSDNEQTDRLNSRVHRYRTNSTYRAMCDETLRRLSIKLGATSVNTSVPDESNVDESNSSHTTPTESDLSQQECEKNALRRAGNVTRHKYQFYMQLALTAALNSNDPKTQVGCVLVDSNKHLISIGYNAFPYGFDEQMREQGDKLMADWKDHLIVHAEANAIHHCRDPSRLKGAVVYVTLFPCSQCAKMLIHHQVASVIYWSFRQDPKFVGCDDVTRKNCDTYYCAKVMFEMAGIPVTPYASTSLSYNPNSHARLDNIVRIVRKQVMLYSSLKEREMQTKDEPWPNTESTSQTDE